MKKITLFMTLIGFLFVQLNGQITSYPYLEDFENGPGGWTANNTINGSWALGNPGAPTINSAASGQNAWASNLTGNYNPNEDSWVESPVFDLTTLSNPQIEFNIWWEAEQGWDGLVLQSSIDNGLTWQNIGALGDPNNWYNSGNIFSNPGGQSQGWSGDFGAGSGGWVAARHDISGLAGQGQVLFRFAFASDGVVQNDGVGLDDIAITDVNCPQPLNLTAINVQATTADLAWTETGTATLWDIELGLSGFSPSGSPTVALNASNPLTVSGLTPSTSYDYYVRSVCGGSNGNSSWSGPYTFTTACPTAITPFLEDVESHTPTTFFSLSNCWTESSPGSYDWNIDGIGSTPSSGTGPTAANSGTNYFYVEASGSNQTDTAYLVSPIIDLSNLTAPAIEFYYHMYGGVMGNLFIDVFNGTWTQVDSIMGQQQTAQADPWIKRLIDISSYTGLIQVRFRAASLGSFQGDISIDDIQVKELPTCLDPTNLGVSNLTANAADLSWVENGLAVVWDIEHGLSGFTPTGVPTITGTTTMPHNLNGLLPSTAYDFYVRSDCGVTNGKSNWAGPFTFTTLCAPFIAPWIDSVESHVPTTLLTQSNCWEARSNGVYDWNIDGVGSTPSSGTGPLGANSGSNYFYIEGSGGAQGDTANLVTPMLDISGLNAAGLEFYYHMFGANMGNLFIDIFDGTTWTNNVDSLIGQQQVNQSDPWLLKAVDLSSFGNIIRVRFRAIKAGIITGDISLDDIAIVETVTCPQPDSLTLSLATNTSVNVSWIEKGTATIWKIEYDTSGFTLGTGSSIITSATTHQFAGLIANKSYDFYVRSICGPQDSSIWLGPGTISTTNVGVEEHSLGSELSIYPNPNQGQFKVTFDGRLHKQVTMKVIDATGRLIWAKQLNDPHGLISQTIDLNEQSKGVYFFVVTSNKGTHATQFFVQ